jgi:hypothetical protein
MLKGLLRQTGFVTIWLQKGARFIEPQVSVGAQSQNTEIDVPLRFQFQADSVALLLQIGWIRCKGYVVLPGYPQGIHQVVPQIVFTANRMIMRNSDPFIQLNNS